MPARIARIASLLAAFAFVGAPATRAQELTESHLQAALAVIAAQPAFEQFNDILPTLADDVQQILLQQRLDLYSVISQATFDTAFELAQRRVDLNNDLARIWARAFTEQELRDIAGFFASPAGQKLSSMGQEMVQASNQAAQAWAARLRDELLEETVATLNEQGYQFTVAPAAPVNPVTPAPTPAPAPAPAPAPTPAPAPAPAP